MQKLNNNARTQKVSDAGFSIVELMVSMIVFMIFMGAIYGALRIGTIQKTTASAQTDVIKNARLSLNTIGRDAVNAGFGYSPVGAYAPDNFLTARMGIPSDANTAHDLLTSVISGNDINTNALLPVGRTDVIGFVYRDVSFNGGAPLGIERGETFGTTGVELTARVDPSAFTNPYDLFLISEGTRTSLGLVTAVPGTGRKLRFSTGVLDPLGVNMRYTGTIDNRSKLFACDPLPTPPISQDCLDYDGGLVTAQKVTWVSYSVTSDGTLVRTIYGNNTGRPANEQIQVQPIAFNVKNFQVKYLLRDGSISDDPSNASANQDILKYVVQIDVTITALIQTVENGVTVNNISDIKSTFSTKNLSYNNN
jgi:type II secretory pathway pseudopilin PulG